jgi:hypothetical protein
MQETYTLSVEKRMQASEHWKVLGKEIAKEVEESIEKQSQGKSIKTTRARYTFLTRTSLHSAVQCIPF